MSSIVDLKNLQVFIEPTPELALVESTPMLAKPIAYFCNSRLSLERIGGILIQIVPFVTGESKKLGWDLVLGSLAPLIPFIGIIQHKMPLARGRPPLRGFVLAPEKMKN